MPTGGFYIILDPALPCWDRWISIIIPLRLSMIWRTEIDHNDVIGGNVAPSVIWRHLYNNFLIPRVLITYYFWSSIERMPEGGGVGCLS